MLDNVSLKIEQLAHENGGSYIDAMTHFAKEFEIPDFEDILEVLNPNVVAKLRQEFIDKNFIPGMKNKNSIENFMRD